MYYIEIYIIIINRHIDGEQLLFGCVVSLFIII